MEVGSQAKPKPPFPGSENPLFQLPLLVPPGPEEPGVGGVGETRCQGLGLGFGVKGPEFKMSSALWPWISYSTSLGLNAYQFPRGL